MISWVRQPFGRLRAIGRVSPALDLGVPGLGVVPFARLLRVYNAACSGSSLKRESNLGFTIAAAATLIFLALMFVADANGSQRGVMIFKPLASTAFIAAGLAAVTESSGYALAILVGLSLSLWGDVLLIPKDRPQIFQLGIRAFLLGHVAYSVAFVVRGVDWSTVLSALVVLAGVGAVVLRWLTPHTPSEMRIAVTAYVVVISTMVALSLGTYAAHGQPAIVVGAVMFYVSDLSVAMDRFVRQSLIHRLWGLPCYYIAQLVLAWTIGNAG